MALRVGTGEWNEEDQCKDFLLKTWRSYALHENDSYDNDYGNVFMRTILIIQSRKNVPCRHASQQSSDETISRNLSSRLTLSHITSSIISSKAGKFDRGGSFLVNKCGNCNKELTVERFLIRMDQ